MEYVYAAMLLHKAGQKITEEGINKVLHSAGIKANEVKVKSLVAALEGINIDKAIEKGAAMPAPVAAVPEKKEEKKKEEEKKTEEATAAGLSALFG